MGVKHIARALIDPLASLGVADSPILGSKEEVQHPEGLSEEDKEYIRMARARQAATGKSATGYKRGGKVKRRYKRGGVVRGAGICKRGIRKAKMY